MAKQGMKRPEIEHRKNEISPVPILEGKAKSGKIKANPLIAGADGKVYHSVTQTQDRLSAVYPAVENDLAAENIINDFDMTLADLQDLL
jgi:hypothetical protein